MELEYQVIKLTFSDSGPPLSDPQASVAVRPKQAAGAPYVTPVVLSFALTEAVPPGASAQQIHDAAVAQARSMLRAEAVETLLQRSLDTQAQALRQ